MDINKLRTLLQEQNNAIVSGNTPNTPTIDETTVNTSNLTPDNNIIVDPYTNEQKKLIQKTARTYELVPYNAFSDAYKTSRIISQLNADYIDDRSFSGIYPDVYRPSRFDSKMSSAELMSGLQSPEMLEHRRSEKQDALSAYGSSMTKLTLKTGTNVVGGLTGLIYGVGSALYNWDASKFLDNSLMQALDNANKYIDKTLPVYKSLDFKEKGFFGKALSHPLMLFDLSTDAAAFIAGAVITEAAAAALTASTGIGVTALAANSARILAQGSRFLSAFKKAEVAAEAINKTSKLVRVIDKTRKAATKADDVLSISKYADKLASTRTIDRALGNARKLATGAGFESILQANHFYTDLKQTYANNRREEFRNKFRTDYEAVENMPKTTDVEMAEYLKAKQALQKRENAAVLKDVLNFEDKALTAGYGIFALNMATVGISNLIQFPSIFGLRFANSLLPKSLVKLEKSTAGKFLSKTNKEKIKKGVDEALETGETLAENKVKEEAIEESTKTLNLPGFFKRKVLGKEIRGAALDETVKLKFTPPKGVFKHLDNIKTFIKNPLSEGTEEFLQGFYDEALKDYYLKKYDPDNVTRSASLVDSMSKSILYNLTDPNASTEAWMGFFMGLIGMPGKGLLPGKLGIDAQTGKRADLWVGGSYGAFKERKELYSNVERFVNYFNEKGNSFPLSTRLLIQNTVESLHTNQKALDGLIENDKKAFLDAQDQDLFSFVRARELAGLGQTVDDYVESLKEMDADSYFKLFDIQDNNLSTEEKEKAKQESINRLENRIKAIRKAIRTVNKIEDTNQFEYYDPDVEDYKEQLAFLLSYGDIIDQRQDEILQAIDEHSNKIIDGASLLFLLKRSMHPVDKERIRRLSAKKKLMEEQIKEIDKTIEDVKAQIDLIERDKGEVSPEVVALNNELNIKKLTLKRQILELELENKRLTGKKDVNAVINNNTKLKELRKELSSVEEELSANVIEKRNKLLKELDNRRKELEEFKVKKQQLISELNTSIVELKNSLKNAYDGVITELDKLSEVNKEFDSKSKDEKEPQQLSLFLGDEFDSNPVNAQKAKVQEALDKFKTISFILDISRDELPEDLIEVIDEFEKSLQEIQNELESLNSDNLDSKAFTEKFSNVLEKIDTLKLNTVDAHLKTKEKNIENEVNTLTNNISSTVSSLKVVSSSKEEAKQRAINSLNSLKAIKTSLEEDFKDEMRAYYNTKKKIEEKRGERYTEKELDEKTKSDDKHLFEFNRQFTIGTEEDFDAFEKEVRDILNIYEDIYGQIQKANVQKDKINVERVNSLIKDLQRLENSRLYAIDMLKFFATRKGRDFAVLASRKARYEVFHKHILARDVADQKYKEIDEALDKAIEEALANVPNTPEYEPVRATIKRSVYLKYEFKNANGDLVEGKVYKTDNNELVFVANENSNAVEEIDLTTDTFKDNDQVSDIKAKHLKEVLSEKHKAIEENIEQKKKELDKELEDKRKSLLKEIKSLYFKFPDKLSKIVQNLYENKLKHLKSVRSDIEKSYDLKIKNASSYKEIDRLKKLKEAELKAIDVIIEATKNSINKIKQKIVALTNDYVDNYDFNRNVFVTEIIGGIVNQINEDLTTAQETHYNKALEGIEKLSDKDPDLYEKHLNALEKANEEAIKRINDEVENTRIFLEKSFNDPKIEYIERNVNKVETTIKALRDDKLKELSLEETKQKEKAEEEAEKETEEFLSKYKIKVQTLKAILYRESIGDFSDGKYSKVEQAVDLPIPQVGRIDRETGEYFAIGDIILNRKTNTRYLVVTYRNQNNEDYNVYFEINNDGLAIPIKLYYNEIDGLDDKTVTVVEKTNVEVKFDGDLAIYTTEDGREFLTLVSFQSELLPEDRADYLKTHPKEIEIHFMDEPKNIVHIEKDKNQIKYILDKLNNSTGSKAYKEVDSKGNSHTYPIIEINGRQAYVKYSLKKPVKVKYKVKNKKTGKYEEKEKVIFVYKDAKPINAIKLTPVIDKNEFEKKIKEGTLTADDVESLSTSSKSTISNFTSVEIAQSDFYGKTANAFGENHYEIIKLNGEYYAVKKLPKAYIIYEDSGAIGNGFVPPMLYNSENKPIGVNWDRFKFLNKGLNDLYEKDPNTLDPTETTREHHEYEDKIDTLSSLAGVDILYKVIEKNNKKVIVDDVDANGLPIFNSEPSQRRYYNFINKQLELLGLEEFTKRFKVKYVIYNKDNVKYFEGDSDEIAKSGLDENLNVIDEDTVTIRVVIVDENGNDVLVDDAGNVSIVGKPVYTSLHTPSYANQGLAGSEEFKEAVMNEHKKKRAAIIKSLTQDPSKPIYSSITNSSSGHILFVKPEYSESGGFRRRGVPLEDAFEGNILDIPLSVVTLSDKLPVAIFNIDGKVVTVSCDFAILGHVVTVVKAPNGKYKVIPLITRKITHNEALTVARLLRKVTLENKNELNDIPILPKESTEGTEKTSLITRIIHYGIGNGNSYKHTQFYVDSKKKVIVYGKNTMTFNEFNTEEGFTTLVRWLETTKTFNVNKDLIALSGKFTEYTLDEKGNLKFNIYNSYAKYLLAKSSKSVENPIITTDIALYGGKKGPTFGQINLIVGDVIDNEGNILHQDTKYKKSDFKDSKTKESAEESTKKSNTESGDKNSGLPTGFRRLGTGLANTSSNSSNTPTGFRPFSQSPKKNTSEEDVKDPNDLFIDLYNETTLGFEETGEYPNPGEPNGKNRLNTKQDTNYERENIEKVREWFKQNLPNVPLEVVNRLIETSKGKAFGVYVNGIVKIWEDAEIGTAFHEAFHVVFNSALNTNEKKTLLNTVREKFGKDIDDDTAEEILAEDFRLWKLTGKSDLYTDNNNVKKSLFEKILDFIKKIVDFFTNINNANKIKDLYEAIDSGKFKHINLSKSVNVKTRIADLNTVQVYELVQTVQGRFIHSFIKDGSFIDPKTINKRLIIALFSVLNDRTIDFSIREKVLNNIEDFMNEVALSLQQSGFSVEFTNKLVLDTIYAVNTAKTSGKAKLSQFSTSIKYDDTEKVDDIIEVQAIEVDEFGNEINRDNSQEELIETFTYDEIGEIDKFDDSLSKSHLSKINKGIKLILSGLLEKSDMHTSIGTERYIPFAEVYKTLVNELNGTTTWEGVYGIKHKLQMLAAKSPKYKQLLDYIESLNDKDKVQFISLFAQTFSSKKFRFVRIIINNNGSRVINSDQFTIARKLRNDLINGYITSEYHAEISENKKKAEKYNHFDTKDHPEGLKIAFSDVNNINDPKIRESVENKLRKLGLHIFIRDSILKDKDRMRELIAVIEAILKYNVEQKRIMSDPFSANIINSRLSRLINYVADDTLDFVEYMHLNPEGKPVFEVSSNNYYSTFVNVAKQASKIADATERRMFLEKHFPAIVKAAPYSSWAQIILDGMASDIDIGFSEGVVLNITTPEGIKTFDLSPQDLVFKYLLLYHESKKAGSKTSYIVLRRPSDKSLEPILINLPYSSFDSRSYTIVQLILFEASNNNFKITPNILDPTLFQVVKQIISKHKGSKKELNESDLKNIENELMTLSTELKDSFDKNFINKELEELKEYLDYLNLTNSKYNILKEHIDNFDDDFLKSFIYDFFHTRLEMHMLFLGDFSQFSQLFKRTSGPVATGKAFIQSTEVDDFIQSSENNTNNHIDTIIRDSIKSNNPRARFDLIFRLSEKNKIILLNKIQDSIKVVNNDNTKKILTELYNVVNSVQVTNTDLNIGIIKTKMYSVEDDTIQQFAAIARELYKGSNLSKKEIDEEINYLLSKYKDIQTTDGIGYITLDMYRELLIRAGEWDFDSQESLYNKVKAGEKIDPREILKVFPVLKTQGYGSKVNNIEQTYDSESNERFVTVTPITKNTVYFAKHALFPIIPTIGENSALTVLAKSMEESGIHLVFDETSIKSKITDELEINIFDDTPNVYTDENGVEHYNVPIIHMDGFSARLNTFKIQVDTHNFAEDKVVDGRQIRVKIFDNLFDGGIPTDFDGTEEEFKQLLTSENGIQELRKRSKIFNHYLDYKNTYSNIIYKNFNSFLNSIGLTAIDARTNEPITDLKKYFSHELDDDGSGVIISDNLYSDVEFVVSDYNKFINELKKSLFEMNVPSTVLDQIQVETIERLDKNGNKITINRLKLSIDSLPVVSLIENILYSKFRKSSLRIEKQGTAYVQVPNAYISNPDINQNRSQIFSKEKLNDKDVKTLNEISKNLNFIRNENGKILAAEVYLPNYMAKKLGITTADDLDKIDPRLLNIIGYRIPTQGLNSMLPIKIKGFLPAEFGDTVVIPYEVIAQNDSDFDIDKLYVFRPNVKYKYDSKALNNVKTIETDVNNQLSLANIYDFRLNINSKDPEEILEQLQNFVELVETKKENNEYLSKGELLAYDIIRHYLNNINIVKVEYIEGKVDGNLKEMENKLLEIQHSILLDHNTPSMILPLSAAYLKKEANIQYYMKKEGKMPPSDMTDKDLENYRLSSENDPVKLLSFIEELQQGLTFKSGKRNVSISASYSVLHTGLSFKPVNIVIKDVVINCPFHGKSTVTKHKDYDDTIESVIRFGKKFDASGHVISTHIGMYISANVDIAKDPFIFKLNSNEITNTSRLGLILVGAPRDFVSRFFTQDIIERFTYLKMSSSSLIIKYTDKSNLTPRRTNNPDDYFDYDFYYEYYHSRKKDTGLYKSEREILIQILKEFGVELKNNEDPYKYLKKVNANGRTLTVEDLNLGLTKQMDPDKWNKMQIQILADFIAYRKLGSELITLNKYSSSDKANIYSLSSSYEFSTNQSLSGFSIDLLEPFDEITFQSSKLFNQLFSTITFYCIDIQKYLVHSLKNAGVYPKPKDLDKIREGALSLIFQMSIVHKSTGVYRVFTKDEIYKLISSENQNNTVRKLKRFFEALDNPIFNNNLVFSIDKNGVDSIALRQKQFDEYTIKLLYQAFEELRVYYPNVYNELLKVIAATTGYSNRSNNLLRLINPEVYSEDMSKLLYGIDSRYGVSQEFKNIESFIISSLQSAIFKYAQYNNNIVPKLNLNDYNVEGVYEDGKLIVLSGNKAKLHSFKVVRRIETDDKTYYVNDLYIKVDRNNKGESLYLLVNSSGVQNALEFHDKPSRILEKIDSDKPKIDDNFKTIDKSTEKMLMRFNENMPESTALDYIRDILPIQMFKLLNLSSNNINEIKATNLNEDIGRAKQSRKMSSNDNNTFIHNPNNIPVTENTYITRVDKPYNEEEAFNNYKKKMLEDPFIKELISDIERVRKGSILEAPRSVTINMPVLEQDNTLEILNNFAPGRINLITDNVLYRRFISKDLDAAFKTKLLPNSNKVLIQALEEGNICVVFIEKESFLKSGKVLDKANDEKTTGILLINPSKEEIAKTIINNPNKGLTIVVPTVLSMLNPKRAMQFIDQMRDILMDTTPISEMTDTTRLDTLVDETIAKYWSKMTLSERKNFNNC
ncbi:MAG: hypothetical protein HPY57_12795 [Ignavibacteria bacterium]|nr:hypothetical protein [Ignavibacteria bacterium]